MYFVMYFLSFFLLKNFIMTYISKNAILKIVCVKSKGEV